MLNNSHSSYSPTPLLPYLKMHTSQCGVALHRMGELRRSFVSNQIALFKLLLAHAACENFTRKHTRPYAGIHLQTYGHWLERRVAPQRICKILHPLVFHIVVREIEYR
eukprot:TRINITY_DN3929_c1_g3_i2.p4 TRINITY_DN3929_c1_g3~~TRINITY_DN3929_c1_g3_i2.p4  ORF type:complete len:108 (-),score=12.57 TRINITY_DN3929_c1_g3_i2:258-581(-)